MSNSEKIISNCVLVGLGIGFIAVTTAVAGPLGTAVGTATAKKLIDGAGVAVQNNLSSKIKK